MLVAHDELDLPHRVPRGSSSTAGTAGRTACATSSRTSGTARFHRLRVGIGHPGHKDQGHELGAQVLPLAARGFQRGDETAAASSACPMSASPPLFNALTAAGHRCRELPVLHHRPERRRGAGAGSAPQRWRHRQSADVSCRPPSNSSISPASSRARRRARGSATSSSPTSARRTPSRTWCAASRTPTSCTWPAHRPDRTTSKSSTPSCCSPISPAVEKARKRPRSRPRPATRKIARRDCCRACATPGCRASRRAPSAVPDEHRQVVREMFLLTAKPVMYVANVDESGLRQPAPRRVRARRGAGRRRSRRGLCRHRGRDRPARRRRRDGLPRRPGPRASPGLNRVIRAGYKLLGLQTYFTAARRKSAPGPC
jgi:hypothetical protein